MIGYLEGRIIDFREDGILLLAGSVGYEILLGKETLDEVKNAGADDIVSLFIYYHQTDRQPKPVLIGFNTQEEKAFFQLFISVDAIGPLKAVKAMEIPVHRIASAIENGDIKTLSGLKGIGKRSAQKIVATLSGKAGEFTRDQQGERVEDHAADDTSTIQDPSDMAALVIDVLVGQLGHTAVDARRMVAEALDRMPEISSPEVLFDEVYRGRKP